MRYHVDDEKLKRVIEERGYAHVTDFVRAHGFNRATLHHYLKGKGPISESYYALCEALDCDPIELLSPISRADVQDIDEILPIAQALSAADRSIAVGLLGSRAKGAGRRYSDWDLGITRGQRALDGIAYLRLKRTVDDAVDTLPREVDFVNLDVAPAWFLENIDYEPILLAGEANAWNFFLGVLHGAKKREEG